MLLNVVNFLPGDEMKLTINGSVIPQESISFTFHENGRNEIQKGMRLPPYTSITCKPTSPPFVFGENTIGIEMTKSAPGSYDCSLYTRNLSVPEIEIGISASGRPVLEVMSEIEERYAPPVKSLAGYHPEAQKAHVDARYGGTTKQPIGDRTFIKGTELVSRGAQAFVLDKEAIIERVDICVSSTPDVREPLRLSVRGDKNGLPADKPVDAGAIASFDPLETPEGLSSLALNGYYRLTFTKPLILAAGSYWLVFEMDPSEQPQQSQVSMPTDSQPLPSSCYRILLASTAHKEYPRGRYLAWTDEGWEEVKQLGQELAAFFGVFEKTGKG
jgi:hypothetical protein